MTLERLQGTALTLAMALGALLPTAGEAEPAHGPAADSEEPDSHWLPWTGCWEPVVPGEEQGDAAQGEEAPAAEPTLVCFRPDPESDGVWVQGVVDGEIVSEEPLVADGQEQAVERSGCTGTETARWSQDGKRLLLRSELECGEVLRVQTSTLAFDTPEEWVEVESVRAGDGDPEASVRRFRAVSDDELAARGVPPFERPEDLALATTREAAASPITADDVREMAEHLAPQAVTAFLLERNVELALDARTLVELEDAGTPSEVIDVLVALAHPEDFDIDAETAQAQRSAPAADTRGTAYGPVPGARGWIVLGPAPRPLRSGLFGSYYGPAYRLGPPMPRYRGGHGGVRVTRRESAGTRLGRVVQGLGYIRGDGPPTTSSRGGEGAGGNGDRPPRRTRGSDDGSDSDGRSRITPQGATQGGDRGSSSGGDADRRGDRSSGSGDGDRRRGGGSSGGGGDGDGGGP